MSNEQDQSYIYRKSTAPNLADPANKYFDTTFTTFKSDKAHRDQWLIDGIPIQYNESRVDPLGADKYLRGTFGPLLSDEEAKRGWNGLIESVRRLNGTTHVLDLMGGAYCVPPDVLANMDSLTGLRLEDISKEYGEEIRDKIDAHKKSIAQRPNFEAYRHLLGSVELEQRTFNLLQSAHNRSCVYGDVWKKQTWAELNRHMTSRGIPHFDLVFCRPDGPFLNQNIFPTAPDQQNQILPNKGDYIAYEMGFIRLLSESTKRMHRNGGILLTQIPELFTNTTIEKWKQHLCQDRRFTAKISEAKSRSILGQEYIGHIMRLDFHGDVSSTDSDAQ